MAEQPVVSFPQSRGQARTAQVFVRDRDTADIIRQSLINLGIRDAEFASSDIDAAIAALARQPSPRLLIVDITGIEAPVTRVNALADVCEPNTGVVVIGDRNDIVLYRDLKNAGVYEYFFTPLVGDLVTRTCNAILTGAVDQTTTRTGKLVFVLGTRGGVGATTLAVNTAWYLAETRQRWVMLLDLDLQNGDAALQLDVAPSHALREAFEHPERVDKLFLERAVIRVHQRIDLLASLEPLSEALEYDERAVMSLLETLLHRYRFVFVDIPSSRAVRLLQTLHMPSTCVLVSNGTLVSAREVTRWHRLIGSNTSERATIHVLNQHGGPGCLPDAEFNRAAGRAPDIVVEYDREIGIASSLGVKSTQKVASLRRGLAPLLSHLSGEATDVSRPFLRRLFG